MDAIEAAERLHEDAVKAERSWDHPYYVDCRLVVLMQVLILDLYERMQVLENLRGNE